MGREESQQQQQQTLIVTKMEGFGEDSAGGELNGHSSIDILEVVCVGGGSGDDEGGGALVTITTPQPNQNQRLEQSNSGGCGGGGGGNPKKRIRTSKLLEEMDKKSLLEQYVIERQTNVNLQLQNRVSQLERELREMERSAQEKEKIHIETLSLAEEHHRGNVLAELGRLLEAEFNCSICNEVFIEPAVLNCGHTYCSYCINRALQTDFLCPVCRTGYNFNPPAKNIEMRNFINKMFQILPEDMRTVRDQVLQERAAQPMPNANENNRARPRRRRSRSVSPFDLFGMFNDDDAFRERRSRSRSVSTLSDSDDSDSAISFFDLRASPRSPSPERPLRSRTRSRSPTSGSRRRRSPNRYAGGLIPLPWRSPLWTSHTPARPSSSRYAPQAIEDRRPRQTARRGRTFNTGRSFSGTAPGPRRYGWGPPRRLAQVNRESMNHNSNTNNNNNDNPSSSAGNNAPGGNEFGNRRRVSLGLTPYRPVTHRAGRWGGFGTTRDSVSAGAGTSLRHYPTPPRVGRAIPLPANFEDLFSRRDPVDNPSTAVDNIAVSVAPTQPIVNRDHDHSYTSSAANSIAAAISAAALRVRERVPTPNPGSNSLTVAVNSSNMNDSLRSGFERIQELEAQLQTQRLYEATSNAAAVNRLGTGHLSQALARLVPPSASDNTTGSSGSPTANNHATASSNNNPSSIGEAEPRRSPRIARQFRHRFLAPTTTSSMYRESERDRDQDMRERDQEFNSQGSSNSHSQNQAYSQDSQSGGTGSVLSDTGGTRGSSVDNSPTSSEIEAPVPVVSPINDTGMDAMRRFVEDLHTYGGVIPTNVRESRTSGHRDRGDRDRRPVQGGAGPSRSSRDNRDRTRTGRRGSIEMLEGMDLF